MSEFERICEILNDALYEGKFTAFPVMDFQVKHCAYTETIVVNLSQPTIDSNSSSKLIDCCSNLLKKHGYEFPDNHTICYDPF